MEPWHLFVGGVIVTIASNMLTWIIARSRSEGVTSSQIDHLEAMLNEREKDITRIETAIEKVHDARHALRNELLTQQREYWGEVGRRLDGLRDEIKRLDGNICNVCRMKNQ